ncbi:DNA replication/repair protein RecF [Sphingomonas sp. FW199]|uniref:DNA replication/repair protein RecF n=1 Tax=Sphingomonas sp. FW199 TaxID=3400217 RepID=UPI003CFAE359
MLSRLTLTDFRNHAALDLDPGAGFVVLTGDNGAGKTNVLEAVSLLAPGRGLRRAALSAMARDGGPGNFAVTAELDGGTRVGTGTAASAPERRIVRVNGANAPAGALAEWLSVLWLTPAMDRLFVEAASERRRFLDRLTLALAPRHGTEVTRYEAAMRQRGRLLADERPADPQWLDALEARMAEHGRAVHAARAATVAMLGERLAEAPADRFPAMSAVLEGWESQADLAAILRRGRTRDAAAGRAIEGPHRVDLSVTHLGKGQAAANCSTGEQKALLLSIMLGHAALVEERRGAPPVLLLDEVAAHLDPHARAALFERLAGRGQVWMTGTETAPFVMLGDRASWVRIGG